MQVYLYQCRTCGAREESTTRGDTIGPCGRRYGDIVCPGEMRRRFQVSMPFVMQEHFNSAVGGPISDQKQFESELRKKSDLASQHTGMEHKYVPVDMNDKKGLGVDGRGIDESNRIRSRIGAPMLPDIT